MLNGEPVGSEGAQRIHEAVEALGPPAYPSKKNGSLPAPVVVNDGRQELLDALNDARAELNARNSEALGSIVYEAVRLEVRPVADRMNVFFERLIEEMAGLGEATDSERRERLDDIALLVDLVTTGWRSVDRRIGRVEKMLERLEGGRQGNGPAPHPAPRLR